MKTLTCIVVSLTLLSACGGRVNDEHPPLYTPPLLVNGHEILRDCPEAGTFYAEDEAGVPWWECLTNAEMREQGAAKQQAADAWRRDAGLSD